MRHGVAVSLLTVVVSACSSPNGPSALSVEATLDRTVVPSGEVVSVSTEIQNTGQVALRIPGGPLVAFVEVRNSVNHVLVFGRCGSCIA